MELVNNQQINFKQLFITILIVYQLSIKYYKIKLY